MDKSIFPMDVTFTEDSDLDMSTIESIKRKEFGGLFRIVPSGEKLPADWLFGTVSEGFTFSNKNKVSEIFCDRTKVLKIDWNQKLCFINPIYPDLKLHTRQLIYNRLVMLNENITLIMGEFSTSLDKVKLFLEEGYNYGGLNEE